MVSASTSSFFNCSNCNLQSLVLAGSTLALPTGVMTILNAFANNRILAFASATEFDALIHFRMYFVYCSLCSSPSEKHASTLTVGFLEGNLQRTFSDCGDIVSCPNSFPRDLRGSSNFFFDRCRDPRGLMPEEV